MSLLFINPDGGKDIAEIIVGVIFGVIVITIMIIAIIIFVIVKLDLFGAVILSKNDYEMLMYNGGIM